MQTKYVNTLTTNLPERDQGVGDYWALGALGAGVSVDVGEGGCGL